jgi:Ser/Thr protein kinase RdoA (MazF antagonist)
MVVTDDGLITLFDCDDSAYGTPSHDVAIVLFYWILGIEADQPHETRRFTSNFMNGYERWATLPSDWPEEADLFLTHREAEIYWLLSAGDGQDMSPHEHRFMTQRRDRLLRGVPYLGAPLVEIL